MSQHCDFGALGDELVRDRIVVELQSVKFSEKLQVGPTLTLQSAINTARQNEWVKKQQEVLRSGLSPAPSEVKEVNEAKGKQERRPREPKYRRPKHVCVVGNASENSLPQECPTKDATCVKCNKRGHFTLSRQTNKMRFTTMRMNTMAAFFLGRLETQERK